MTVMEWIVETWHDWFPLVTTKPEIVPSDTLRPVLKKLAKKAKRRRETIP